MTEEDAAGKTFLLILLLRNIFFMILIAMKVSDDVLRMILQDFTVDEKTRLRGVSRQFKRVLDDMFARQRKLCLGYRVKDKRHCSAKDVSHEVQKRDFFEVWTLDKKCCFGQAKGYECLKCSSLVNGLAWLLKQFPNLQVLIMGNYFTGLFPGIDKVLEVFLPNVSNKLCCLSIRDIKMSTPLIKKLKTRSLKHFKSGRITGAAKQMLRMNNPGVKIRLRP